MNGRAGWTVLLFILFAVGVGVLSYTAGVSHGLAIAPAAGSVPYARQWGWGWGFGPLFFLGFWFVTCAVFRGFLWGGIRCGYGARWSGQSFDEWHRHAHEEMNKKP